MSKPISELYICSGLLLSPAYKHTIYFDSVENQRAYFQGKVVKTYLDYSYIRHNSAIRVAASMDEALSWDYLFYRNNEGVTFYCFINNVRYINDNVVELETEVDVMQTYMFSYALTPCFIEREHAADDTIGLHTLDEGLELGEYEAALTMDITSPKELCILVMSTIEPMTKVKVVAARYNGVYSGVGIYAVDMEDWNAWGVKLKLLDDEGLSDAIIAMWMYPKALVVLEEGESWEDAAVTHQVHSAGTLTAEGMIMPTSFNTTRFYGNENMFGGYYPRNNKLLTYPYNYLYVSNNAGGSAVYRWEAFDFVGETPEFNITGAISPDATIKMIPKNYNGVVNNYEHGITLSGYPSCAWNQDVYKLWLAQNQNQQDLSMISAGLTIAGGVATAAIGSFTGVGLAAGAGAVIHGASQIGQMMAQRKDKSIQPPQARGVYSANVNVATGKQTFTLTAQQITVENARIIDGYFDMFGYKCHRVKVPNRAVRENWTYTKTIDCQIVSNISQTDKLKIESIYDAGITFWKNGDSIGMYTNSNKTVGEVTA